MNIRKVNASKIVQENSSRCTEAFCSYGKNCFPVRFFVVATGTVSAGKTFNRKLRFAEWCPLNGQLVRTNRSVRFARQKTSYEQTVKHRSDFLNLGRKLVSLTCCPASFPVHLLNWQNKDRVLDWRKRQNICDCCGILRPLCISTHAAKSARVKTVEGVVMSTSEGASRNNETYWRQASSAVLRYTEPCESRCALCALRYGWGQKSCDLRATKFMGAP